MGMDRVMVDRKGRGVGVLLDMPDHITNERFGNVVNRPDIPMGVLVV